MQCTAHRKRSREPCGAHVERCAECRAELEKLMRDVAVVAMSVDQQPLPAGARQRFMEKISAAPEGVKRGAGGGGD